MPAGKSPELIDLSDSLMNGPSAFHTFWKGDQITGLYMNFFPFHSPDRDFPFVNVTGLFVVIFPWKG